MGGENIFSCAECGKSYYESDLIWKRTHEGRREKLPFCAKCIRKVEIRLIYSKDDFITDMNWLGGYGISKKEAKQFIFSLLDNGKRIGKLCSPTGETKVKKKMFKK